MKRGAGGLKLVLRGGSLVSLLLAGVCSVQAQGVRGVGETRQTGSAPVLPADGSASAPGQADGLSAPGAGSTVAPTGTGAPMLLPGAAGRPGAPAAPTVSRNTYVEGEINVRGTGTDRGRLDRESGKDIVLGVSPRLSFSSRGAQVRLNATVGVDHVRYIKHTDDDYTQPRVNADVQAKVVDNLLFVDGSASVDRRSVSPYSAQSADVPSDEQVRTGIYRVSPRIDHRRPSGWNTLVQSDNIWTRRSGQQVSSDSGNTYSQNTQARFERVPERVGAGIEGSHQTLRYEEGDEDVIRLDSARASLGWAVTPQFTAWALGGAERSRINKISETDGDYGARVRWAPLERSVLTAEVRKRFFGTGFNAQWNHRHRNFGFALGGSREPVTQPDAVQLSGNVAQQFDAIYRSRGYSEAQREALVRATLNTYGLPANLTDPVTLRVNAPQLSTTANGLLSIMGRRSVLVFSAYYRRLVQLRRNDDPVVALAAGDIRQAGGLVSWSLQLTPLSGLEAAYRIDDSHGLGSELGRNSRDQIVSLGTNHALSPKTRVNLSVQHHRLKTDEASRPSTASANSATLGVNYRF